MTEPQLTAAEARDLSIKAGKVFQPRTPISTREFFAGRWEQITTLADAVSQTGLHVVIYGERGVGKTSLANVVKPLIEVFDEKDNPSKANSRLIIKINSDTGDTFESIWQKVFREIPWINSSPPIGFHQERPIQRPQGGRIKIPDVLGVDDVRRVVAQMPGSVFIIDEFHRAANKSARQFTDLIKALSDFSVDSTIVLVGVSETIDTLVGDHASISRALTQILLPRMQQKELREILAKAAKILETQFTEDAENLIVHMSQGLPHYTHLLGQNSVRSAANTKSRIVTSEDVFHALKDAVKQAQQSVTEKYSRAVHSSHKDALYKHVLLACALTASQSQDALGYFNPASVIIPLTRVLQRESPVEISAFNGHMSEFCQEKRSHVLERTGQPRAYRYRFRDPLLVPYIFMDAVTNDLLPTTQLGEMLNGNF